MGQRKQQRNNTSNRPRGTVAVLRTFSPALAQAWALMSEHDRELVAEMHKHFRDEFTRTKGEADPASVAAAVHIVLDEEIARQAVADADNFARIQCRDGCAHCCHQNVTVSRAEAFLLLAWAEHKGVTVDWEKVKRQASHAGAAAWVRQPVGDMRCVFLGQDNRCMVYEHRPNACRRHFAVSPPKDCDIVANPGTQVLYWVPPTVEVIASAALAAHEGASMPVMLQRIKKQFKGATGEEIEG